MDAGQMIMMQMPLGANLPVAAAASSPVRTMPGGEQDGSMFAGVLGGMIAQGPVQPVVMAGVVPAEHPPLSETAVEVAFPVVSEAKPGTVAALETPAVQAPEMVSAAIERAEQPEKDGEQNQPDAPMPQDVALNGAGAQVALTLQMAGRMPESDRMVDVRTDTVGMEAATLNTADAGKGIRQPNPEAGRVAVTEKTAPKPATAETLAAQTEAEPPAVTASSTATPAPREVTVKAAAAQPVPVGNAVSIQAPVAAQNVPQLKQGIEAEEVPAALEAEPAVPKIPVQQIMEAYSRPAATVSNAAAAPAAAMPTEVEPPVAATAAPQPVPVGTAISVQAPAAAQNVPQAIQGIETVEAPAARETEPAAALAAAMPTEVEPPVVATAAPASRESAVATAAPQPVPVQAPVAAQNVPQAILDIEIEEVPATGEAEPAVPKIPVQQIMEAYSRPAVTVSNAPSAAAQADAKAGNTAGAAVTAAQEQGTQRPAPMPELAVMPEQPQAEARVSSVQRPFETGAMSVRAVAKAADGLPAVKEEGPRQQAPTAGTAKTASVAEDQFPGAVKGVSFATSGEESRNGDNPSFDQGMHAQVHQILQQQVKTENAAASSSAAAPLQHDTAGAETSGQVVRQVREHLANHEIKAGEQIVLRLSPEHLGDLTLNVRMENQRLTVEIVTENRMVRDALMQHSDALKDSLAKQNIKMDSFDVTTGGNNGGSAGRDQADWRELARQRQHNAWVAADGYRQQTMAAAQPHRPLYQAKSAHSLVDLHY